MACCCWLSEDDESISISTIGLVLADQSQLNHYVPISPNSSNQMPLFIRPAFSRGRVSKAYDEISSPFLNKALEIGLQSMVDRVCSSNRRNGNYHQKIMALQGDYVRYAKRTAQYARKK